MTISEIISELRRNNNDDGVTPIKADAYYNALIISAIGLLEPFMGALAIREDQYLFNPLRLADRSIQYKADGVTPEIDDLQFYDPDDNTDADRPQNIIVNKTLTVKPGEASGTIQTADFIDGYGVRQREENIAFIKIDANVEFTDPDTVAFDASLDGRESWLNADYGMSIAFDKTDGTTGYLDVSRYPSLYPVLKWTLTGPTAIVHDTLFRRIYIPRQRLRDHAGDIIELAKMALIEIRLDKAIKSQNDPMVINGMLQQIANIRRKYGMDKNSGDTRPVSFGQAISPYADTREAKKIFGGAEASGDILTDKRAVSIVSDGTIRRI